METTCARQAEHGPIPDCGKRFRGRGVPPGSREGVLPDDAALAFARALHGIEPRIAEALEEARRAEEERAERAMVRDLRAAFEAIARARPGLALLPVAPREKGSDPVFQKGSDPLSRGGPASLLPPGPLAEIVVSPDPVAVPRGGRVRLTASCRDALGHPVDRPLALRWSAHGAFATIVPEEAEKGTVPCSATLQAGDDPGTGTIAVVASEGREIAARVAYEILVHVVPRSGNDGIPDPAWIEDAGATWRSRRSADGWEVNAAHPDFRACEGPAAKLRYLTVLLAREVALANAAPDEPPSALVDRITDLLVAAERRLTTRSRSSSARSRGPRGPEAPSSSPPPSP